MSEPLDLDPVTRITAGAVGEPGHRTFFLQARKDRDLVTLLVEKEQVVELARHIEALLARLAEAGHRTPEAPVREAELELEEPLTPWFRVGPMALGYDAERDLVLLQCEELVDEEEGVQEPAVARFWASREQMRALARHGLAVAAAGRPRCPLCGGPIDPDGHFCPAHNGHRGHGTA